MHPFVILLFSLLPLFQDGSVPARGGQATARSQGTRVGGMQFGELNCDQAYSRSEGDEYIYILRSPRLRAGDVVAEAARGILFLDADQYHQLIESGDPLKPGPSFPDVRSRDLLAEARRRAGSEDITKGPWLNLSEAPFRDALRVLYLEGNVRVREGSTRSINAEALLVDAVTGRVLIIDGKLRYDFESGGRPRSLTARARLVRQEITGVAALTDAEFTTCEFAMPHYHVRSKDLSLSSVSRGELLVDAIDNNLVFGQDTSLRIPDAALFTSDLRYLPLESIVVGVSRRDGSFIRSRWGRDFEDIGNDLNRALGVSGRFKGHWSVDIDYLGRRGPALGGTLEYETAGAYRGRTTGFLLSDRGRNIGFLSNVYEESEATRGRFHTINRVQTGDRSWFDFEAAVSSDPLLRAEFFPAEFKTEKEFENIAYYRTAGDSWSFTGLAKGEINRFEPVTTTGLNPGGPTPSQTNAYPFFDGRVYPIAVLDIPIPAGISGLAADRDLELIYRSRSNVGYLERHYAEPDFSPKLAGIPPFDPLNQRALRFDTAHELSAPFSLGFAKISPFVEARETAADRSVPNANLATGLGQSEEDVSRLLLTAGARVGSHLERDYGILRHLVDGRVEVRDQFDSSQDPARFIYFDPADRLGRSARIDLDLRNRISSRDPVTGTRWTVLDSQVIVPYFPDPSRDNAGTKIGNLRTDTRFDFGPRFVVPELRVRNRALLDSHDYSTLKSDTTLLISPFGPEYDFSVSYRESRSDYRAIALAFSTRIDLKWDLDLIEQYDLILNRAIQQQVSLRRYGHDWAIEFSFIFDTNDNSQSISISILPLLGGGDRPRDRFFIPEPRLRGFY